MTEPLDPLAAQIDALRPFLSLLEPGGNIGTWEGGQKDDKGVIQMPWFDFSPEMLEFLRTLSSNGWVVPFDWVSWQEEAAKYSEPAALATADVDTIRKLFTAHVRADRFNEGHLAAQATNGRLAAMIRRLIHIRQTL